jgi:hypothetical protein
MEVRCSYRHLYRPPLTCESAIWSWHRTIEAAQAAAQSDADAAHWANTALGDLIGGK